LQDGESDVELVEDGGCSMAILDTPPPQEASLPTADGSSGPAVQPKKRSRVSARDVQLADRVAGDRMAVAVKNAELREATGIAITNMRIASKKEMLEEQKSLTNRQLDFQEKQLEIQGRQLKCQEEAIAVAREKIASELQNRDVLELTRLYAASGKDPAEAYALAKAAVHAQKEVGL
jgi:hypothetical protein